jgi:hypothetical protein
VARTKREGRGPGRPPVPKSVKKRHVIPFKVDDAELKALDRKAKDMGLSRSEMIRLAIQKLTGKE